MKSLAGIVFAVILVLCSSLATGTIHQNGTAVSSEEPMLVTGSTYSSAATVTKSFYTLSSFATVLLGNPDSSTAFSPTSANTSTAKSIATKIDEGRVSAQPTKNRGDICGVLFGHRCNGFNLRRPHRGQIRGVDGHPLSAAWFESVTIDTSLPSASVDDEPANNSRVSNQIDPTLSLGSGLSAEETIQQLSARGGDTGAAPSVSGAYGDYEPDVPTGAYGYPPNPTNQPTITVPVVITTPVIVQTLVETVTLSLTYIPSSSLPIPLTSPLVNSTQTFPNTTMPGTLMSESSQPPAIEEHTPTTQSVPIISTRSTTLITPGSPSSTYTRHTTWSFESLLHSVTPTPTAPAIDINSARTTTEVNYPLLCFMLALALAGSTAYDVRMSSTSESVEGPTNSLQETENSRTEGLDRTCYVKGFGDEEADTQAKIEEFFAKFGKVDAIRLRRDPLSGRRGQRIFKGSVFVKWEDKNTATEFVNLIPKPEYNGNPLVVKWMLDYAREKKQAIINHQIFMARMRREGRFQM